MALDDGDLDGAWVPRPLPDDDELAREPDPEELERAFAVDAVPLPVPVPVPVPVLAPVPDLASGRGSGLEPEPDAASDLEPLAVAVVPDAAPDLALEALVLPKVLLRSDGAAPEGRHSWTGLFVSGVVLVFFLFAPLQVLAGGILPWALAYAVGATLTIRGGLAAARDVATRGSARLGPVAAAVGGVVVIAVCAVVAVVSSQGRYS